MAYNYSGRYEGGIAYQQFSINERYYLLGGDLEAGLAFQHQSNIVIRLDCSIRRGYTWIRSQWNHSDPSFTEDFRGGSILPKLSIGYQF